MKRNWMTWAAMAGLCSALALSSAAPAAADLKLAAVASPDPVKPGGLVTFRLTATNQGASTVNNLTLHSVVPDGLFASNTTARLSDGGSCAGNCFAGHIVDWSLGSLAAGASRTVEMTVFISSSLTDGTEISTSASVAGDTGKGDQDDASVVVESSPPLAAAIRSERDPVGAGEVLRYTVTFGNPSAMVLSNVTLTAGLPTGAALQTASDGGTEAGGSVMWVLGSVLAGQNGQRQFTVEVPTGAADGEILISDAAIHDASTGGSARATSATTVRTNGPMALALSASPDPVRPGSLLTFRLTATNRGASPLSTVTLHSVVPDVLPASNSVAVVSDGGSCAGNCFAGHIVDWSLGSLAAGASRTVEMTAFVASDSIRFPNSTLITHRAWVLGDGGAVAEQTVAVDSSPLLAVAIRSERDPVGAGEVLRYTVTFGNPSAMVLSNVTLTATLPVGAALQTASDGGTEASGSVMWVLGSVLAGQSGQRQFTVEVPTGAADGEILISDAAIHDASTCGSARATSATTVRTNGPMALALSASPDPVRPGSLLTFRLTATNRGTSPLSIVMLHSVVPDILPASNSAARVSDGGSCAGNCFAGHIVDWSLGSLAVGASRTVEMTAFVASDSTRFTNSTLITNRAWVLGDGGAAAEQTVAVDSSPLLAVAIRSDRDPVGAGEVLRYTVTFGNPSAMVLSKVTLRAGLPMGAAVQTASDGGTEAGGSVTWALGRVPAGQSGQRQFTVQVAATAADGDILVSDAAIHDADTGGSARATSATAVRTNGPMALALSAFPDPVRPGGVLSYSLTVTNLEASPLTTVTLHSVAPDVLPASNSVVVVSDGGSCAGNCFAGHIVDWSLGSLAAGASRTVLMTASLSNDATRFSDGTLIFNPAWTFADGGASASAAASARVCAAGGTACDYHPPTPCVGDCNGDHSVTVNELITMVNIALGNTPLSTCPAGAPTGSGDITINEIIAAVNSALIGCGA